MSRRTLLLVRWGIFLAACAFLFLRLSADQSTHALWGEWRNAVDVAAWPVWGVMFAMAVLNWGIEAAKWRWLEEGLLQTINWQRSLVSPTVVASESPSLQETAIRI